MARNKKVRKKYDPVKKTIDRVKAKAQKYLVCSCSAEDFTQIYTLDGVRVKRGNLPPLDFEHLTINLPKIPMPWTTLMMVQCRDKFGKEYMQAQELAAEQDYPYKVLAQTFGKHHVRLKNEANQEHIIGFGWISSPKGETVTEEIATKIMIDMGAWEGLAQWQIDEQHRQKVLDQQMYGKQL